MANNWKLKNDDELSVWDRITGFFFPKSSDTVAKKANKHIAKATPKPFDSIDAVKYNRVTILGT